MKKILFSLFAPVAALLLTACSGDGEVRQFVNDFAMAVSTDDRAAMEKMYPDAALAEALTIEVNPDSMQVEKAEDGTYTVGLGGGKDLIVAKGDDGTYSIKSSHGVFAIPADKEALAKSTGWYDPSLTDAENAVRLSDTLFVKSMAAKALEQLKEKITVTKKSAPCNFEQHRLNCTVEVSNATDHRISGDDYNVKADIYEYFHLGFMGGTSELTSSHKLTGQSIPANGTTTYNFTAEANSNMGDDGDLRCTVNILLSPEEAVKFYTPTGNEYQEYLNK